MKLIAVIKKTYISLQSRLKRRFEARNVTSGFSHLHLKLSQLSATYEASSHSLFAK
jgi:hypothetical protein